MKLSQILESVTEDEMNTFREWQHACRRASLNCMFAGTVSMGAQAVDWTTVNNEVVGDWSYDTRSGVVYQPGTNGREVLEVIK